MRPVLIFDLVGWDGEGDAVEGHLLNGIKEHIDVALHWQVNEKIFITDIADRSNTGAI